jgi:hypothetical protein
MILLPSSTRLALRLQTCADIQKDIQDSGASLMASSNTTECSLASLEWLGGKSVEALTSKMSEVSNNIL